MWAKQQDIQGVSCREKGRKETETLGVGKGGCRTHQRQEHWTGSLPVEKYKQEGTQNHNKKLLKDAMKVNNPEAEETRTNESREH